MLTTSKILINSRVIWLKKNVKNANSKEFQIKDVFDFQKIWRKM